MFVGGPNGVHSVNTWLVVDCKKNILAVQNGDGVNISVGPFDRNDMSLRLSGELCAVPKTRPDKYLRMF
jgi:hypothetical protein